MHPVIRSKNQHFDLQTFKHTILKVCADHKKKKRALAFALIIHRTTEPQIKKLLADKDYWDALDEISGRFLTVFYIDSTNRRKPRKRKSNEDDLSMSFLTSVQLPRAPANTFYEDIKEEFLSADLDTPYIL